MSEKKRTVAGIDVGTECVKAIVIAEDGEIVGRAILPSHGSFQDCAHEVLTAALDEAQVAQEDLSQLCGTGFGASTLPGVTMTLCESTCHARGAFHHFPQAMTVIDIGGRDPRVIRVDENGHSIYSRSARRCAMGIGSFLIFASRHLDVHPTRLEELAATAESPAPIGSYCSIFAGTEILEKIRDGVSRPEIALGCMHSIAERILEIGGFEEPMVVTGGVPEYFPGVLRILASITKMSVQAIPEPITAGALGAALKAMEVVRA
jgi:predicted CoA-substrate-specific enzyme activase